MSNLFELKDVELTSGSPRSSVSAASRLPPPKGYVPNWVKWQEVPKIEELVMTAHGALYGLIRMPGSPYTLDVLLKPNGDCQYETS